MTTYHSETMQGLEICSIRQTENRSLQFAVCSLQLRVCSFAFAVSRLQFRVAEISNFSKAFSSVQFSSVQFTQNIIQYKNTYRNCKVAREPRRNQNAYEAWAPKS